MATDKPPSTAAGERASDSLLSSAVQAARGSTSQLEEKNLTAPGLQDRRGQRDPFWVRCLLIGTACGMITLLILVPIVHVFGQAFSHGWFAYWENLLDANTRHAMALTLLVSSLAVLANLIFGLAAAWAIAHFRFPGRALLLTLIDLPFSVSPVVAGLIYVLIFGLQGWFGPWLRAHDIHIIF